MAGCEWAALNKKMKEYHDCEWGVPVRDDRVQFEYLALEVMQCGLSWNTVLQKRETLRRAFAGFDYEKLAQFDERDVERILSCDGIIKSQGKSKAILKNARAFMSIRHETGSFSEYLWSFTGGMPLVYRSHQDKGAPARNMLSQRIAEDLKRRGFTYIGAVTVYSHLQACGIINDHARTCPRYEELVHIYGAAETDGE